jgi:protein-S-isoprenylcysteine O-methyltransferase Ste14
MRRSMAAAGSVVFFALAPGVVAGAIPWWLTRWRVHEPLPYWAPLRVVGAVLVVGSAAVLVHSFARFVTEGLGTPAPIAPTRQLVVGGLYRYVRNPMYLAVLVAIAGQALLLGRLALLVYGMLAGIAMVTFTRIHEEPALYDRFGEQYEAYRSAVPGWWPRRQAWSWRRGGEP